MRLLLDECLPRRLKHELAPHDVVTVPERGWAGKKNGELLQLAGGEFDAFITADQNVSYQQNLAGHDIAVIALVARSNRFADLKPLAPAILDQLKTARPGLVTRVTA
jgi:predicted nuclease of predicted toxin-antitoxin system